MKKILNLLFFLLVFSGIKSQSFNPKFFCFEDAFLQDHTNDIAYQTKLIKKIGFDGMELMGLDNISGKMAALEEQNLSLFMVYIAIHLDKPEAFDPRLFDFIISAKNKGVTLWLHIMSNDLQPSDSTGDLICVPLVQKIADFAVLYGVKVALYPHTNFWLEKIDDSFRLTQKINRRNVGAVFNLCHYLKVDQKDKLEEKLIRTIPYLAAVSINGADDGSTNEMNWDRLIQPLGNGSFEVQKVIQILKNNHYTGPIGLQCFAIPGIPAEFLNRSMSSWKKLIENVNR